MICRATLTVVRRKRESNMAKPHELREMSGEQLQFALKEAQDNLFRLRFQSATEKIDATSNLRRLRREIARIKTIQNERLLAAGTTD